MNPRLTNDMQVQQIALSSNSRQTRGKILSILSMIALVALAALVVVLIVIPKILGAQTLTVISGSMEPTYKPGDVVVVRPTPAEAIVSGDVITFQLESGRPEVATHRVVGIKASSDGTREFVTQGDANNAPDLEPVREIQIQGKVAYSIPLVGWATTIFSSDIKEKLLLAAAFGLIGYGAFAILKPNHGAEARSKKKGSHAASLVLVGAVVATAGVLVQSVSVHAAEMPDQPFSVSTDGVNWQTPPLTRFLPSGVAIVPGDSYSGTVLVRNDSAEAIRSTLDVLIESDFQGFGGDVTFSVTDPASGEPVDSFDIAAGQQIELEASVSFAADSNSPALMARDMNVLVTAHSVLVNPPVEEPTSEPSSPSPTASPTPGTGEPTAEPTKDPQSNGGGSPLASTGADSLLIYAALSALCLIAVGALTRRKGSQH